MSYYFEEYDQRLHNYGIKKPAPNPPGLDADLDAHRARVAATRDPDRWHGAPPACCRDATKYPGYMTAVLKCGNLLCQFHGSDVIKMERKYPLYVATNRGLAKPKCQDVSSTGN